MKTLAAVRSIGLGLAAGAMLIGAAGCNKNTKRERVDPHADEDEIVRIDARRQVVYPNATKEGEGAFYLVTQPNPSGASLAGTQWVYLDYTTISFDNRFLGSSVADSAKLYRQWSSNTRYVPRLKKNDAETLGEALYNILQKCHVGDRLTVGMSAKEGNASEMWKSNPNESVIATLTIVRALNDPEAEELNLINDFLNEHTDFTKQDAVYKKVVEAGTGKKIPEDGRVYCKYGVFFLDGTLLETNDEAIAARYGRTLPGNQVQLLSFRVKDDESIVKGLSGICIGETIGTKLEVVMASASAYGDKGKGNVRPYEPLRFELTIVNHTGN